MDYPGLPLSARTLQAALVRHGAKATVQEIAGRDHISIISKVGQTDDPTTKAMVEFIQP
jgi:hypothetical protein